MSLESGGEQVQISSSELQALILYSQGTQLTTTGRQTIERVASLAKVDLF
jgi:hypothetical protein